MIMASDSEQQERFEKKRLAMVDMQIARRGIEDPLVLNAMRTVPRESFLSTDMREHAYEDGPLPILEKQTISQPYIVACMIDELKLTGGEKVLEIGTGSGYAAAVLAQIANQVVTLERHKSLADSARQTLHKLGYNNIDVIHTDGTLGWPEAAPYNAIVETAGAPSVPGALKDQLAVGGRILIPVGSSTTEQSLVRITRVSPDEYHEEHLLGVRFVPLMGEAGWQDE
jgi:protein-L-isoaspartate(D-aspartate) O-methyltransferase